MCEQEKNNIVEDDFFNKNLFKLYNSKCDENNEIIFLLKDKETKPIQENDTVNNLESFKDTLLNIYCTCGNSQYDFFNNLDSENFLLLTNNKEEKINYDRIMHEQVENKCDAISFNEFKEETELLNLNSLRIAFVCNKCKKIHTNTFSERGIVFYVQSDNKEPNNSKNEKILEEIYTKLDEFNRNHYITKNTIYDEAIIKKESNYRKGYNNNDSYKILNDLLKKDNSIFAFLKKSVFTRNSFTVKDHSLTIFNDSIDDKLVLATGELFVNMFSLKKKNKFNKIILNLKTGQSYFRTHKKKSINGRKKSIIKLVNISTGKYVYESGYMYLPDKERENIFKKLVAIIIENKNRHGIKIYNAEKIIEKALYNKDGSMNGHYKELSSLISLNRYNNLYLDCNFLGVFNTIHMQNSCKISNSFGLNDFTKKVNRKLNNIRLKDISAKKALNLKDIKKAFNIKFNMNKINDVYEITSIDHYNSEGKYLMAIYSFLFLNNVIQDKQLLDSIINLYLEKLKEKKLKTTSLTCIFLDTLMLLIMSGKTLDSATSKETFTFFKRALKESLYRNYYISDSYEMLIQIKKYDVEEYRDITFNSKNIKDSHDKLSNILNDIKRKIKNKNHRIKYNEDVLDKLTKSYDNISFAPAPDTHSLINTGSVMNICVGGYTDYAIQKTSNIILGKNNDGVPLICIELNQDCTRLKQFKFKYNDTLCTVFGSLAENKLLEDVFAYINVLNKYCDIDCYDINIENLQVLVNSNDKTKNNEKYKIHSIKEKITLKTEIKDNSLSLVAATDTF